MTLTLTWGAPAPPLAPVLAFPGAEGHGAHATGGRGGDIIVVDNLNDSGLGSWRSAATASGPRIIVFQVGGRIDLASPVSVGPDVTVAMQTAPGDGVTIAGAGCFFGANSIVRGGRFRNATASLDSGMWDTVRGEGPSSGTPASPMILDHCSISWSIDEVLSFFGLVYDVTIGWCIVSEGLHDAQHGEPHSMGLLLGGSEGGMDGVSLHHSLLAHNNQRNPRVQGTRRLEMVSNIVYGWGEWGMQVDEGVIDVDPTINLISNWFKANAESNTGRHLRLTGAFTPGTPIIYLEDNITPSRTSDEQDEWLAVAPNDQGKTALQAMSPFAMSDVPVTVTPRSSLSSVVLPSVGASVARDAVDSRIVTQTTNGTGTIIDAISEVGGHPTLDGGTPWSDNEIPGMDDAWVTAHGVTDPFQTMPSGYSAVEEWINSLIPDPLA